MDGTGTARGEALKVTSVASPADCRGEAERAARKRYDQWASAMWAWGGDEYHVRGGSDVDAWCDEWLADCAPNDMSDAEVEAMRDAFCAEATLLVESYDGPRVSEP